ncbi:hypothetical protein PAXRUDRAFT_831016 [Paxillus rubicundulus Ve08.2h10]|uniref:Unplaced genomic scaffold scaffold_589, whole genome shotgun sequence n=1 Tax=Paxillus rubicundulus Ve08.2h10 TaxID=930991 RepID=A0A0D0D405_9AGAM|nr:hypothetical protein PAXRUDRAFT_831016 [Paxillus rubicundulus Ve08.2h10]
MNRRCTYGVHTSHIDNNAARLGSNPRRIRADTTNLKVNGFCYRSAEMWDKVPRTTHPVEDQNSRGEQVASSEVHGSA